jgi:hypothetical protein
MNTDMSAPHSCVWGFFDRIETLMKLTIRKTIRMAAGVILIILGIPLLPVPVIPEIVLILIGSSLLFPEKFKEIKGKIQEKIKNRKSK